MVFKVFAALSLRGGPRTDYGASQGLGEVGSHLAYIVASHKPQTREQQIQISSAAGAADIALAGA